MTLDDLFTRHPSAKSRLMRATVVAMRARGFRPHDFRHSRFVMDRRGVAIQFDGQEFVRLTENDLTQRMD